MFAAKPSLSTLNISSRLLAFAVISSVLALSGCGAEKSPPCSPIGENLIQDDSFSTLFDSRRDRQWHISEHAAGESFAFSVVDGTLDIIKTGHEPWTIVSQSLNPELLSGKTIVVAAELKLDLTEPADIHGFKYGAGLSISAKKQGRLVVNSTLNHEPHMGVSDWQPISVIIDVPPKVDSFRFAVLHQAGGKMQIRKPSLHLVNSDAGFCPPTPDDSKA